MSKKPNPVESTVQEIVDKLMSLEEDEPFQNYRRMLVDARMPLVKILNIEKRKGKGWERRPYHGLPNSSGDFYTGYVRELAMAYASHFGRNEFTPIEAVIFLKSNREAMSKLLGYTQFENLVSARGRVYGLFYRGLLERRPSNRGSFFRFVEQAIVELGLEPVVPAQSY